MAARRGALPAAVAAAALAVGACHGRPAADRGDVVLVTVDTLRADHLGLYGYARPTTPQLDRWFEDGAIFERAYTTHAATPPSVVSILTGTLPQEHGVRLFWQLLPRGQKLLPDLLPPAYRSAAFVASVVLTEEAMGLAARFDHYDDYVDERESSRPVHERSARRTTDAALAWLATEADPERPLFLWVHYIDPHGPYRPPADWRRSFEHGESVPIDPERVPDYQRLPGVSDGLDYVDAYDEEIAYLDAQIGRLLAGFDGMRGLDRDLLLLTADHGETMMEHERWFSHGYQVYEEIARVPLMLRGPGVESGRRPGPATILDLAPTILGFAGGEVPAALPGVDLRRGDPPPRTLFTEAFSSGWQWRAAIRGDAKWVLRLERGSGVEGGRRYFDLAADPGERSPADWPEGAAPADELLALARRDPDPGGLPTSYRRGVKLEVPKIAPRADASALEALRALGYVD